MIRLKYYREKSNLSQAELSKKLNMSQQAISAYENGTREPDIKTIDIICNFFNITSDELLGRKISINESIPIAASTKGSIDLSDVCDEDKEAIMRFIEMAKNKNKKD